MDNENMNQQDGNAEHSDDPSHKANKRIKEEDEHKLDDHPEEAPHTDIDAGRKKKQRKKGKVKKKYIIPHPISFFGL